MKEIKNTKPTKTEVKAAMELQAPSAIQHVQGDDKPVQRVSTFQQLAKVSRNARLAFGAAMQWIKPEMLFNGTYRDGYESTPFFVTKAFKYKSKEIPGERLGLEIALSNGRMYNIGFGLNENDSVRSQILAMFTTADGKPNPQSEPIGPFCIKRLPTDKGNDYWNIVPYFQENVGAAEIEIPFAEINDSEILF